MIWVTFSAIVIWHFHSFIKLIHSLKSNETNQFFCVITIWSEFNVTRWNDILICCLFICCCSWGRSNFQVNKNPMTCLLSHTFIYSKYDIVKRFPHTFITLNHSLSNLIISSQRLVTMSVSLHTQTVLRCLIIQVLNIQSLLPKCLIQSPSLLYTVI